jgi:hypothetical protein
VRYNPYRVRRCVRIAEVAQGDIVTFTARSFTRAGADTAYHPAVDLQTGQVRCDCPHFTYRLARLNPTVRDWESVCKHLLRAIDNLERRGLLPKGGAR